MQFSYEWLSALCPSGRSPEDVAEALTSRGLTVDSMDRAGDDHVFEVDVPANRGDCLGYVGVARELSAAFGTPLSLSAEPATATTALGS